MRKAIRDAFDGFEEALDRVRRRERANYQLEMSAQVLVSEIGSIVEKTPKVLEATAGFRRAVHGLTGGGKDINASIFIDKDAEQRALQAVADATHRYRAALEDATMSEEARILRPDLSE